MSEFSTKDLELSEKLQQEGCTVKAMRQDPVDKLPIHIFEEDESEVNKILGIKGTVKTEEPEETEPETLEDPGESKPKKRRKKKRGGKR